MSTFFILGVWAILTVGIMLGGRGLNRMRDREIRYTEARKAGPFLFLLCMIWSVWFFIVLGRLIGVI